MALTARLYLCGFPKAGLHLADRWAGALLTPEPSIAGNWFSTFSGGGWEAGPTNLELVERAMRSIRPGHYLKGHLGWSPELAALVGGLGIGLAFVMRDLRDVVVSHAHHVCSTDDRRFKHPDKEAYRALGGFEDVLIGCIEGVGEYPGVFGRWELYAGWLKARWILPLRFEQMIEHPRQWAAVLARYLYARAGQRPERHLRTLAREMVRAGQQTEQSVTYRRGIPGEWRAAFTPRVRECFKAHDPGWLIELGYEKDGNW